MKLISDQPNSTSRIYIASGAIWAFLGALTGLTAALELIAPDFVGHYQFLSFGRIRPLHVNLIAFAGVYTLFLGAASHIVPRLCRVEGLWSEKLGSANALILWNLVFVCAVFTLPFGHTQGREYAELVWWIDWMLAISVILFAFNIMMTLVTRRERLLYVSLWYICGGLIWTILVYFIGNVMWNPPEGALMGIVDSIWLWFYGHNVVGLILTPLGVGVAYYVIPRAARAPVFSHGLSLIGFWMLLVMYTHVGTHHLLQAPVPRWLKVISIVDSIGLMLPVSAVLINLWVPLRGRWGFLHRDIGAKFAFAGTVWYLITCIQGPLQALPAVQQLTHFTHWVVGHAHTAVFGFAGFIAIGGAYAVLPAIAKRPIHSRSLADLQYWLMLIGLSIMTLSLTMAGLVQGNQWHNNEAFYRVLPQLPVYHIFRAIAGVMILTGWGIMAYNVTLTLFGPTREAEDASATSPTGAPSVGEVTA